MKTLYTDKINIQRMKLICEIVIQFTVSTTCYQKYFKVAFEY